MKSGRTIIIGDVHGCIDELEKLLKKTNTDPHRDQILFLGDLVNKGPESEKVFDLFLDLKADAILGNHEHAILKQHRGDWKLAKSYKRLKKEFGKSFERFVDEIETWPAYLDTHDFLAVHAGVRPDLPPAETQIQELVNMRTWDGEGLDFQNDDDPPWYEFYTAEKLVIFGHWAAKEGVTRKNAIGLDTGCVYGKHLSALVLPEREIVSVQAKKQYCEIR